MKKFKRRWFNVGTVPVYYNDDGTVAINETLIDFVLLHALANKKEPDRFSEMHVVYVEVDEEPGHVEMEVKDEDSKDV